MDDQLFTVSKKEKELMELLWDAGKPLARPEILELAAQRENTTWKPNSLHILVNSLLDKGAVKVSGLYMNAKKFGRTYEPTVTRAEYAVMQVVVAIEMALDETSLTLDDIMAVFETQEEEKKEAAGDQ